MQVLIAFASRHGSTREIGNAITAELCALGLKAELRDAGDVKSIEGYGAVILGSAVYMGRWMSEAKAFAQRFETQLAAVPVWLFSSGPLGDDVTPPAADPAGLHALKEQTHAREHRVFAGSLNRAELGMGERMVTRMVHAPEGDYRDWAAIHAWAREIAAALSVPTS